MFNIIKNFYLARKFVTIFVAYFSARKQQIVTVSNKNHKHLHMMYKFSN